MARPIISVRDLTKSYRLYAKPSDRLKEVLWPWKQRHTLFHALNDVNFDVYPGEYLGILGQNGAGKSTLLQVLTGVLTPTAGTVEVNGRVAALLELGAGFNPELTGRENILFQMQLAGIGKDVMPAKLIEVQSFADIGDFFDQPVKLYSSGMFARVAFSSAILTEPEILIVDEVLAVGDVKFQVKCYDRLQQFRESGGTILFVSHALSSITSFCTKALYLKSGSLHMMGEPNTVTKAYYNDQFEGNTPGVRQIPEGKQLRTAGHIQLCPVTTQEMIDVCLQTIPILGDGSARIVNCGFYDAQGEKTYVLQQEARYYFHAAVYPLADIAYWHCSVSFRNGKGLILLGTGTKLLEKYLPPLKKGEIQDIIFYMSLPFIHEPILISVAIGDGEQAAFDSLQDHIIINTFTNDKLFKNSFVNADIDILI